LLGHPHSRLRGLFLLGEERATGKLAPAARSRSAVVDTPQHRVFETLGSLPPAIRRREGGFAVQSWFDFYAVIGAAAATLTGLLFVAMSMNVAAALGKGPHGSRRLAEQAFENYLAVLMVSLLALYPDMSLHTFGRVTLVVTATWTAWVVVRLYQAAAEPSAHETRTAALRSHISTMIGFGLLIYSALCMALDGPDMRDTLAAANIVLLFSATEKAWSLLNRIAEVKQSE
jgi:hypothetical protein